MSVLLGRQRICDGCGKTVFKKYIGDDYIFSVDMNKIVDDYYFDNDIDNDWAHVDYIGDLCPTCIEKTKRALSDMKKGSSDIGYVAIECTNDETDA